MYIAVGTVALPNGVTVQAGERRHGGDPVVTGWPQWFKDETSVTPEQIRSEEAQKFDRLSAPTWTARHASRPSSARFSFV
jgi:hypothetical protein